MTEQGVRRLKTFALVTSVFAFSIALTVVTFGLRTPFTWFLLVGTLLSVLLNLWMRRKDQLAAG